MNFQVGQVYVGSCGCTFTIHSIKGAIIIYSRSDARCCLTKFIDPDLSINFLKFNFSSFERMLLTYKAKLDTISEIKRIVNDETI